MIDGARWYAVKDGDYHLRYMLNKHYSARHYKDNRTVRLSVGPGNKLCLLTVDGLAAFIWRIFISDLEPPQTGINCAMFRNEGPHLSSSLILEAEELALVKWKDQTRFWTMVDAGKIKSTNPGYCFIQAGWVRQGVSKSGKVILYKECEL